MSRRGANVSNKAYAAFVAAMKRFNFQSICMCACVVFVHRIDGIDNSHRWQREWNVVDITRRWLFPKPNPVRCQFISHASSWVAVVCMPNVDGWLCAIDMYIVAATPLPHKKTARAGWWICNVSIWFAALIACLENLELDILCVGKLSPILACIRAAYWRDARARALARTMLAVYFTKWNQICAVIEKMKSTNSWNKYFYFSLVNTKPYTAHRIRLTGSWCNRSRCSCSQLCLWMWQHRTEYTHTHTNSPTPQRMSSRRG